MHLNVVPASQGMRWLLSGVTALRRHPLALLGLFFLLTALLGVLSLIPGIGIALALGLLPSATLGFMNATREVVHGHFPMPFTMLAALRSGPEQTRSFLQLGLFYILLFALSMTAAWLPDEGQFVRFYLLGEGGTPDALAQLIHSRPFQIAALTAGTLNVVIAMLFWHAPGLVFWHGVPPSKALFFSLVACLRNFAAFLVFLTGWMGLLVLVAMMSSLLFTAMLGPVAGVAMMQLALAVVFTTFFASQYFSFQDCFIEARDAAADRFMTPPADPS